MPDTDWIEDANGNRCSVAYFGSHKAAEKALASLVECQGCSDCSGCSGCSDCLRCSDCSDCLRCSDCSGCSDCSDCSRCSDCLRCSGCSDCLRCLDCSRCSNVAHLYERTALKGDPEVDWTGPPPIPAIESIHQKIYEAASAPGALDMSIWHTCGATHCRAGWAVHLAGEAGYALARFHNTALAAQLIYGASGHPISPVRFYDSNDAALADMKRLAAEVA